METHPRTIIEKQKIYINEGHEEKIQKINKKLKGKAELRLEIR